jgi:hypothetical protein
LALGNLSKEQKNMLFTDYKDEMTAVNGRGQGYLHLDGQGGLQRVVIPAVRDHDKLTAAIKDGLTR